MVNSGSLGLLHACRAAEERALQEQPRRHVHRRHRQGRRRGRQGVRDGVRHRRLRQRRLPGHPGDRVRPVHALPQQRQRHVHRRHRQGRARRAGLDDERRVVRLRQRRQARSLPLQLRAVLARRATSSAATTSSGKRFYCIPRVFKPTPSLLFHNNGDGTFTEVSAGTDIQRAMGKALGVVATDINDDGLMDLFVANDTVQNFLFVEPRQGQVGGDRPRRGSRLQRQRHAALGHGRRRGRRRRRRQAGSVRGQRRPGDVLALPERRQRVLLRRRRLSRRRAGDAAAERLGPEVLRLRQRRPRRPVPRQRPSRRHDRELLAAGALQGAAAAVPQRRQEAGERQRAGRPGLPEDVSRRAASRSATTTTTAASTSSSATTATRRCC